MSSRSGDTSAKRNPGQFLVFLSQVDERKCGGAGARTSGCRLPEQWVLFIQSQSCPRLDHTPTLGRLQYHTPDIAATSLCSEFVDSILAPKPAPAAILTIIPPGYALIA
jgi:hypothetical protein